MEVTVLRGKPKIVQDQPEKADDLTCSEMDLHSRMEIMERLRRLSLRLNDIEIEYVTLGKGETILRCMRKVLKEVSSECSITSCSNSCEVFRGICSNCTEMTNVELNLSTIRNVKLRVEYITSKLSSSLSNRIKSQDILDAFDESGKLLLCTGERF